MWIVYKQVGIFTHYLTAKREFQPGIEKAHRFPAEQTAVTMAKIHGAKVKQLDR